VVEYKKKERERERERERDQLREIDDMGDKRSAERGRTTDRCGVRKREDGCT
jgi:hypothetical protein